MKKLYIFIVLIILLFAGCDKSANDTVPDTVPDTAPGGVTSEPSANVQDAPPDVPADVPAAVVTTSPEPETEIDAGEPVEYVDSLFAAVKANDASKIGAVYEDIAGFSGGADDADSEKLVAEVFRRLSWENIESRAAGGSFEVTCEISNVDMSDAVSQFLVDSNRLVSENEALPDGERLSEEQINERLTGMLITAIKAADKIMTKKVTFMVAKNNGEWQIELNGDLKDALTGGYEEAVRQSGFGIYN